MIPFRLYLQQLIINNKTDKSYPNLAYLTCKVHWMRNCTDYKKSPTVRRTRIWVESNPRKSSVVKWSPIQELTGPSYAFF